MSLARVLKAVGTAAVLVCSLSACSNAPSQAADCCTVWVVNVDSGLVKSGVEVFLDGQSIYRAAEASAYRHRQEVWRSVRTGEHAIECVVLAAESQSASFQLSVTSQSRPGGDFLFFHGERTPLNVGERLKATVVQ